MSSKTRLFKELKELQADTRETEIELVADENNIYRWTGYLQGPVDTPYEGGTFQVSVNVPTQYPLTPPAIKFVTKVFHPNVHWKARRAFTPFTRRSSNTSCTCHTLRCVPSPALTCHGAQTGEICLDILKSAWSPAWTLQSVCRAILSLLAHAAPDSPLNCDAGNLLRAGDVLGYNSMARCYTVEYASARRLPREPPS